jgi:hypothetical protein
MEDKTHTEFLELLGAAPGLSERVLTTYVRLWQLETWLRNIVYVELRAKYGDQWIEKMQDRNVDRARENDAQLTHMPSPEITDISFSSFGTLRKVIAEEWDLFKVYLPPQNIWEARIQEVEQIRHRVAHFRRGHRDDLKRVVQLLRDLDDGAWKFYASFNSASSFSPPSNDSRDPVIYEFAYLIPYRPAANIKYQGDGKFMGLRTVMELDIEVVCRPWKPPHEGVGVVGIPGYVYDLRIVGLDSRKVDYEAFLEQTRDVHPHVIYFVLDTRQSWIRVMLPALLPQEKLIHITTRLIQTASTCLHRTRRLDHNEGMDERDEWYDRQQAKVQRIADSWPEYVIGPNHPIAILEPDTRATIFVV